MNPAALVAILNGDFANAMAASTPGGIEAQEAAGMQTLIHSDFLPRKITGVTWLALEAIGFKVGLDQHNDDLFAPCILPSGWKKVATDHSMNSDLVDDKGRKRASIFYKAAFYDRQADIHFHRRHFVTTGAGEAPKKHSRVTVMDGQTILRDFGIYSWGDYHKEEAMMKEAKAWLDATYPDHASATAYWD